MGYVLIFVIILILFLLMETILFLDQIPLLMASCPLASYYVV